MLPGFRHATAADLTRPVSVAFPGEIPRGGYRVVRDLGERIHVQRDGAPAGTIVPAEWVLVRSR